MAQPRQRTHGSSTVGLLTNAAAQPVNVRLGEVPIVAGEAFSAADITTLVTVDSPSMGLKMAIPETAEAMKTWYDTVAARPSARPELGVDQSAQQTNPRPPVRDGNRC